MKKLIFSLMVLGGFILLGTTIAKADETPKKSEQAVQTVRPGYVDANNDGICDNYDGTRPGKGLGPGNGQGIGRATGKGLGRGQGLRDGSGAGQGRLSGSMRNYPRRAR